MTRKLFFFAMLILLTLALGLAPARAQEGGGVGIQAALGAAFTYQGQLKQGGNPVNGNCDFQFGLWDAATAGAQIGSTQTKTNVSVTNGLFTVQLDFGAGAFNGEARWLEIGVRCPAGSGSYTALSPRQALTPAPHALALPGLWTQQNATSPNLIGGFHGNSVTGGVVGATIGGGGTSGFTNRVTDNYGTVGGGANNQAGNGGTNLADAHYATVGGGLQNTASNSAATVGGGYNNTASGADATVAGGNSNQASGNYATVGGGRSNNANNQYATVGGGLQNTASGDRATVGGGGDNQASGYIATVGGGGQNQASGNQATVGGGGGNQANGQSATVGGGVFNTASGLEATVGGGLQNTASGDRATVGGGYQNTASGNAATVGGGANNTAAGDYSFVVGRRARNTDANHDGVFLFADSNDSDFSSTAANQFRVRATGGAQFVSGIDGSGNPNAGVQLAAGGGSWSSISDRAAKENFADVNSREVLARVAALPIQTWNYKSQPDAIRHIGPTAQDFYAAFGVGEDDKHITTIDADGVALAAIQGLYGVVQEKDAEIANLKSQISNLEARLAALERGAGVAHSAGPDLNAWAMGIVLLGALGGGMWLIRQRKGDL